MRACSSIRALRWVSAPSSKTRFSSARSTISASIRASDAVAVSSETAFDLFASRANSSRSRALRSAARAPSRAVRAVAAVSFACSAFSRASSRALCVTPADSSAPMRHAERPPKRSPARVTATTSGRASAASSARDQSPSTRICPASSRANTASKPGSEVRTQSTSARVPGGTISPCTDWTEESTTSSKARASPATRLSRARRAAPPPFITIARIASPRALATAASVPASIVR